MGEAALDAPPLGAEDAGAAEAPAVEGFGVRDDSAFPQAAIPNAAALRRPPIRTFRRGTGLFGSIDLALLAVILVDGTPED
jgi:hypothetical protein